MTGEIFFNGRAWRQVLGDEQLVRFLELLYNRAGGAQDVTLTLSEVISVVGEMEDNIRRYEARIHKLEHRINQLEDAQ